MAKPTHRIEGCVAVDAPREGGRHVAPHTHTQNRASAAVDRSPRGGGGRIATVGIGAGPAEAAGTADYVGGGQMLDITGRTGDGAWNRYRAGEMPIRIDGGVVVVAYCIDIHTAIGTDTGRGLDETDWATSGIRNLDQVAHILNTYDAATGAGGLVGNHAQRAAGIQAAIWHYTDGFELAQTGATHANVWANYQTILAEMPAEGLPPEPAPSLQVLPGAVTATVGEVAGPFTVTMTAAVATVAVTDGVEVVDWATGEPVTEVTDGAVVGIRGGAEGATVQFEMTATGTIHAGRVFAKLDAEGKPIVQRLILATTTEATTTAVGQATFEAQPTTTTTVPEETTTTTVPEETTTTTVVEETTTTTVAEETTTTTVGDPEVAATTTVPAEVLGVTVERGDLPRTGRNTGVALATGLVVMVAGALLVAAERRHADA